eukprot:scaffold17396_cov65-Phaeocystis_antarctica.AAC.5
MVKRPPGAGTRKAGPKFQHAAVPSPLSRFSAAIAEPSAAFAKAAVSKSSLGSSRLARGLVEVIFFLLRRLGGEGLTTVQSTSS